MDSLQPLPETFYLRPTLKVARDLLGTLFVRKIGNNIIAGRIVEVEAYHENGDESSHSYRGCTPRNEVMFRRGGLLYVYFTYGMHFCMNVVTEKEGTGAAVLIRAMEPIAGIELMQHRRGEFISRIDLTNGPAKCCQAFGIDKRQNGISLQGPGETICRGEKISDDRVLKSSRIGIRRSTELQWRFRIAGNPFISKPPGPVNRGL
jgi:DNA-3-methyladenine glycosylase